MKCEICECADLRPITITAVYTRGEPLYVCEGCGFVQVIERRTPKEIYQAWVNAEPGDDVYHSAHAAVAARHAYVKAFVSDFGERPIDIGGGDGAFSKMVSGCMNWNSMAETIPNAFDSASDTAIILWTLENCGDANAVIRAAWRVLKPNGKLVVATGSRLLVPYKKPLHQYIGPGDQDLHPWRFSANSLQRLLWKHGFIPTLINDYIGCDYLVVVAKKESDQALTPPPDGLVDNPRKVEEFFNSWHKYTQEWFPS